MKRKTFMWLLFLLAAGALLAPVQSALADDESDELQIEIKAPLEAADCDVTPQTITVLGLTIDVTGAHFESGDDGDSNDESEGHLSASSEQEEENEGEDEGDVEDDDVPATCADLVVGQTVEVKLAGDLTPLMATEVEQEDDSSEIEIQAPIQAVAPMLGTITLLGLPIDISTADVEGCDDEDDDSSNQGIDPNTLMVGQFVEVELDPNALPDLVAAQVEVKNYGNMVEVEIEDTLGNEVDDLDEDGQPIPSVTVDVSQSVRTTTAVPTSKGTVKMKKTKRTLRFQAQSNGRVVLHGLPTGKARLSATRQVGDSTSKGRASIAVAPNSTTSTVIRLKGSKSKR
ncbi:MAG: DUF5666 domain-containing protein [Deltaproteobacteria bacterium]|nr:DUF5666 domain-containing protein [Deltaproteobacteria bacterium]